MAKPSQLYDFRLQVMFKHLKGCTDVGKALLAITMAVCENVTYVTTIVLKINTKAVILQELCLLVLLEII